ncbi:hypothetical protein ACD582_10005 [Xanthomonas nasturtii]|uniref:hypothetical protein n=1 Tax=Xanthomonas nasturtii TaxID=1843581 RepID=UPI0020132DF8|nr:hypothetical protein [Xanthomonas nasturtii]MCL1526842.1 hypothetical protein [Xanthomonas nasturtii]
MTTDFENIKIVSFDDKATYKTDPSSALVNAVLELSSSAPAEWADYFNQSWKQHFYMMKRNANVSGDRLETYCVPGELQSLIVEFNKIIAKTNAAYAQHWAQKQQEAAQKSAAAAAERESLSKIKSELKFD